ncbi:MAG: aspartate-semialdehyde dehydrogenase [Helicobacteraceae bacterium]|jgi:aspartate-semialdehyde dehydrogenase|nr:aspartate-semialdehyde dehydrogenase [Helicobacteraceae bacterium]
MAKKFVVAVVGATGAVGAEMIRVLEEHKFPIERLVPLASENSAGKTVEFFGEKVKVLKLTHDSFAQEKIEIALFSAGGAVSAEFAPSAAKAGAVVIDNTSHFRMDEAVPLVVPEVNPEDIKNWKNKGIIANPNCSTIQMMIALKPLHDAFGLERLDIATYQAVSGAGAKAMDELMTQMRAVFDFDYDRVEPKKFPHKIALNAIPHIDSFTESGFTKEELKMVYESQKILRHKMQVSATCVRIPVLRGHSEAIAARFSREVDLKKAIEALKNAEDVVVLDDPQKNKYPMPITAADKDEVFVGRIRADLYDPKVLHLWIVADNLRVGAATNAVRIAKKWAELN